MREQIYHYVLWYETKAKCVLVDLLENIALLFTSFNLYHNFVSYKVNSKVNILF